MRTIITPTMILLLAVTLSLAPGCGGKSSDKKAERAIEDAMAQDGQKADVKIDSKSGSMSIKTKDGKDDVAINTGKDGVTVTSTGEDGKTVATYSSDGESGNVKSADGTTMSFGKGAKLPEGFPKDVPLYAGAEITMSSADPANKTFSVQATSADGVDKVAEYYKTEMKSQGWTEGDGVVQTGDNPMHMLNFEKGDSTALVMVMAQEGKAMLSLTIAPK